MSSLKEPPQRPTYMPVEKNGSRVDPREERGVASVDERRRARREEAREVSVPLAVLALVGAIVAISMALAANQTRGIEPVREPAKPVAVAPLGSSQAPKATANNWDVEARPYDAVTKPVAPGAKTFNLTTKEQRVKVGDRVYTLWTFNDTVPGPVLRAVEGDMVTINITNASSSRMLHSVDFHASRLTMGGGHVQVAPGKTGTFTFKAEYPGVFMYHCATPPVLEHIGRGMHGMIIVQPREGFGKPMPEYAFVQSELYTGLDAMQAGTPSEMAFNGIPNQYVGSPIRLKPDTDVRMFFLNAGPSELSSFHVVGTVFDRVLEDGNPANLSVGRQALAVPASGGAVFEMQLVGEGRFPIVTHQFDHVAGGAVGMMVTGDGEPGTATPQGGSRKAH